MFTFDIFRTPKTSPAGSSHTPYKNKRFMIYELPPRAKDVTCVSDSWLK
jgi:hypothetical protein